MRIAIVGCAHGELEIIYNVIQEIEKVDGKKIDLLICCGDFQATRNLYDLNCMSVSKKYKSMCSFYKYYSGKKVAPLLTIFIGGNHEASNYLQELPYGGWVAPNIYYLGYANVITIGGIRIAGISGIYKSYNWMQGHHEMPPYTPNTINSVYHIRNLEVFRLKQISGNIDIFLSHDWPCGVTKYGNENKIMREKPFLKSDIETNSLGSPANMELLKHHYPSYWFSAHLHYKFPALIPEKDGSRVTKFLALDKCLPGRKFLQVLELEHNPNLPLTLNYDLEWLTILYLTNHLLSIKTGIHYMPGKGGSGRWLYTPTNEEKENILKKFNYDLQIPMNFEQTVKPYNPELIHHQNEKPGLIINNQTTTFCNTLGIDDPLALLQIILHSKEDKVNETILESTLESTLESNDMSITFEEDNECEDTTKHSINVIDENFSDVLPIERVESDLHSSNFITETEPNCKKFKRRNCSIYSNTL